MLFIACNRLLLRVLFKSTNGSAKEEFWQDKSLAEEELVKMGDINNFKTLVGSLNNNTRKSFRKEEPDARTKNVLREELF